MTRWLLTAALAACATHAPADDPGGSCDGKCDGSGSGSDPTPPTPPTPTSPATLRANLLANLFAQMDAPSVLFGQQRFNITGVNDDGTEWFATEDALDRSDAKTITGEHPAVLGLDVYDLAIKPATWIPTPQVHADAAKHVYAAGGVVTMTWHMQGCAAATFDAPGNEACLCKIANDDDYARSWLLEGNYKIFADALVQDGLDQIPIVFRPLHEHNGNWFWWGAPYWSCASYVTNPRFTGAAAYQRVYQTIVTYLRVERGLQNLLIAYSPGGDPALATADGYLAGYPGDAYVDIFGADMYYQASPSFDDQTTAFQQQLATITALARSHDKVAALTEVGNTQLSSDTTPAQSTWFETQLQPLLGSASLAYAMTWENRTAGAEQFWVPYGTTPGVADFQAFEASPTTAFLSKAPAFAVAPATYPVCGSCASADANGDGWGWENEASCRVGSWCVAPAYPLCKTCASDPDGDGWGWENGASCQILPTCS